jgi:hypothetical protein
MHTLFILLYNEEGVCMEKITKYAKFNYSKEDEDLIVELEAQLNKDVEEIYNFFDSSLPRELVTIIIIPTKNEYDERSKKRRKIDEIPKWSIGTYYDNTIEYVSLHDYKNTSHAFDDDKYYEKLDYYKKTIVHEYVHFVTDLYCKKNNFNHPIKCFNEGIAQYLSHQREGQEYDFYYTLEDILNSNNSYVGWFLLTKYIIEEYGRDYFLELFTNKELSLKEIPRLYQEAKEYYDNRLKRNL